MAAEREWSLETALGAQLTSWRIGPFMSLTFGCAALGAIAAAFLPPWGRAVAAAIAVLPGAWLLLASRNPLLKTRAATLAVRPDGLYLDGSRVARRGAHLDVLRDISGMVILRVGSPLGRSLEAILPDEETAAALADALGAHLHHAGVQVACVYGARAFTWAIAIALFIASSLVQRGSLLHVTGLSLAALVFWLLAAWDVPGRLVIDDEALSLRHTLRRRRLARASIVGGRALFGGGLEVDFTSGGHVDLDVAWRLRLGGASAELVAARLDRGTP